MKLHKFSRIVFVQAARILAEAEISGNRALPVIEIKKHGRVMGGGPEQIAKMPQGIGPYGLLFKGTGPKFIKTFAGKNVEMIKPKINHHFLKLPGTLDGAQEPCLDGLFRDDQGAFSCSLRE